MLLLFAWTLEIRSNRIDGKVLEVDDFAIGFALAGKEPDERYRSLKEITERYPTVRFNSTLLSRSTINGIILRSEFLGWRDSDTDPCPSVKKLTKAKDLPSWQSLWHAKAICPPRRSRR